MKGQTGEFIPPRAPPNVPYPGARERERERERDGRLWQAKSLRIVPILSKSRRISLRCVLETNRERERERERENEKNCG